MKLLHQIFFADWLGTTKSFANAAVFVMFGCNLSAA
jgi:hypothetical protein